MREIPILFNDEMVRAILDGKKTQTRRVVKWPAWVPEKDRIKILPTGICRVEDGRVVRRMRCPYGEPGDALWVREAWRITSMDGAFCPRRAAYRAGGERPLYVSTGQQGAEPPSYPVAALRSLWARESDPVKWCPSIHMPRWASRLTLRVTSVRVERVQGISDADIAAEGLTVTAPATETTPAIGYVDLPSGNRIHSTLRGCWEDLWTSVYGADSWSENPWVWAVSFRPEVRYA